MILTWRWPPTLVLRRMLREMGELEHGCSGECFNTGDFAGGGGE